MYIKVVGKSDLIVNCPFFYFLFLIFNSGLSQMLLQSYWELVKTNPTWFIREKIFPHETWQILDKKSFTLLKSSGV